MIKHICIKVTGKVQGVFFRASAKERADALNVKGFVRNEADNTVYIEAEAEEEALKNFTTWCQHGPRLAQVNYCDIQESDLKGFKDFVIDR